MRPGEEEAGSTDAGGGETERWTRDDSRRVLDEDENMLTPRTYLQKPLVELARQNPDVEVIVRKQPRGTAAVIRGHYSEC